MSEELKAEIGAVGSEEGGLALAPELATLHPSSVMQEFLQSAPLAAITVTALQWQAVSVAARSGQVLRLVEMLRAGFGGLVTLAEDGEAPVFNLAVEAACKGRQAGTLLLLLQTKSQGVLLRLKAHKHGWDSGMAKAVRACAMATTPWIEGLRMLLMHSTALLLHPDFKKVREETWHAWWDPYMEHADIPKDAKSVMHATAAAFSLLRKRMVSCHALASKVSVILASAFCGSGSGSGSGLGQGSGHGSGHGSGSESDSDAGAGRARDAGWGEPGNEDLAMSSQVL
jgi:hypothetical protein